MRYLTHYEEYPIFEPAEGGYYYAGNAIVESERMSKRAARKNIEEIWRDAKAYNLEEFGEEEPTRDEDRFGNSIYPWYRSLDGNMVWRRGRYIGEGESYIVERRRGSEERGWVPYC